MHSKLSTSLQFIFFFTRCMCMGICIISFGNIASIYNIFKWWTLATVHVNTDAHYSKTASFPLILIKTKDTNNSIVNQRRHFNACLVWMWHWAVIINTCLVWKCHWAVIINTCLVWKCHWAVLINTCLVWKCHWAVLINASLVWKCHWAVIINTCLVWKCHWAVITNACLVWKCHWAVLHKSVIQK